MHKNNDFIESILKWLVELLLFVGLIFLLCGINMSKAFIDQALYFWIGALLCSITILTLTLNAFFEIFIKIRKKITNIYIFFEAFTIIGLIVLTFAFLVSQWASPEKDTRFGPLFTGTGTILSVFMALLLYERSSKSELQKSQMKEIRNLKNARPSVEVTTVHGESAINVKLFFPKNGVWLNYPDVYFDSKYSLQYENTNNPICHQQMGSIIFNDIKIDTNDSKDTDGNFRFVIKADTVFNETIYICYFANQPIYYFFESITGLTDYSSAEDKEYHRTSQMSGAVRLFKEEIENAEENDQLCELDPNGNLLLDNESDENITDQPRVVSPYVTTKTTLNPKNLNRFSH